VVDVGGSGGQEGRPERASQRIKIIVALALALLSKAGASKHHHTHGYAYGDGYSPYGDYNSFDYYPGE
jgi:hypothetical protein